MRLLYIHPVALNANMANIIQTFQMCYAFSQAGVDVTLAIPGGDRHMTESDMTALVKNEIGTTPTFRIVPLPRFTLAGRFMAIGTFGGVRSLLKRNRNIDYCFTRISFIAHLAVKSGVKTIYESHGTVINHSSKILDYIYRRCLLRDAQSRNMVLFITISNALAEVWQKRGIPSQKIVALHDGFRAEDFTALISRQKARRVLGIKSNNKMVVYAGSLYKDRGIESILRLANEFPHVHFYIVGGPERSKNSYEAKSSREGLNNVFFTGRVPAYKVKDYLFAADVLLMLWSWAVPTIHVCSPMKVFEYMAAGRIIVGHGFPVIREVLKDGQTALLTQPDSYEDLKSKLRHALTLSYPNTLAQKARITALNNYSWQRRVTAIIEAVG